MCPVLLFLYVDEPVSGSGEGDSQLMQKFLYAVFWFLVFSQLGAGKGTPSLSCGSNVMSPWCIRCFTSSKFQK